MYIKSPIMMAEDCCKQKDDLRVLVINSAFIAGYRDVILTVVFSS